MCLFAVSGFTADAPDQKPQTSAPAAGKTVKDTSLYLYYQQYLKPYFGNSSTKTGDRSKEADQKTASTSATPSGSLVLSRSKPADTASGKQSAEPEEKAYVTLNKIDSVGLDEINRTFPKDFRKEYIAELALGIKLSPLMDLSFGKVQKLERSEGTPWGMHDDGFRIRLKKDF